MIAADNLFEFSLARLRRVLARQGRRRARSRCTGSPTRARVALRRRRARRGRPRVGHGGEAGAPAQRPRLDRDVPLLAARTSRCSSATSTRASRPTRPGASSRGSPSASPSTATGSPSSGSTSATPRSCSRRTTAIGARPGCRRASTRHSPVDNASHRSVTDTSRCSPYRGRRGSSTSSFPSRCVVLRSAGAAVLRVAAARARAGPRAALRPLRRADGVAGRALPRVRRPAARLRLGPRRGRVRRGRPRARSRVEGARAPPARGPGRRARRRASCLARRQTSSRISRPTATAA